MICLGADGASVVAGEFSGVAELLRSDYFHLLIHIHCTAHRINLLVNDPNLRLISSLKTTPSIHC